jgi:malate permease and related proteins
VAAAVLLLLLAFALGVWVQHAFPGERLRSRSWTAYFWTVTPLLVFTAFTTVTFDRGLVLALAAAVLASWAVIAIGYAYAALVADARDERGALVLAAGFPNTGFVGYPLAQLALGNPGLALMVVYDRLAWLVPATAISTTVARLHGRREARPRARRLRTVLASPPLYAALAAVSLRVAGVDLGPAMEPAGDVAAALVGPAGFFLLGLALPLDPPSHDRVDLSRAAGALAIRFAIGPLVLFLSGLAVGADIPAAFYLGAAMPCAFHLLVLARVFDVRPHLMRLLVVGSTVPAVAVVVGVTATFR